MWRKIIEIAFKLRKSRFNYFDIDSNRKLSVSGHSIYPTDYSYLPNKRACLNKRALWNFFKISIIAHSGNDQYNQKGWKIIAEN